MKLEKYLKENKIAVVDFADLIGAHRTAVHNWLSGASRPNKTYMPIVIQKTKGLVSANDFYNTPLKEGGNNNKGESYE